MKILVTGGDGQLARCIIERGKGTGLDIVALRRTEADLAVPGSLAAAIRSVAPDVVINAAAFTAVDLAEDEPDLALRINADAAGEAAAAAGDLGAAIVQLSTDYVFDGRAQVPYREDAATGPLGVYGRSKLAGEGQVRAANPRHVIVRTAWLYSPFGRNFVRTMIEAARTRDWLNVVDDQVGSPTSALDLADGLLAMVGRWRGGEQAGIGTTYHLAGSGVTSWCGLAEEVMTCCRALGLPSAAVRPIKTVDWPTKAARPASSVLDSGKFARDFGFVMPDWRHSVADVVRRLGRA